MRGGPPHNPAQSFEAGIIESSKAYVAAGYRHIPKPDPAPFKPKSPGIFSPAILEGEAIPERRWIVEGLIPAGNVTMLAGDGGLGKSLLAMQLLACVTLGKPWLDIPTTQCNALAVFCEDERDELHIRQQAINQHYGCSFSDLAPCLWMPRVGEANVMRHFGERGPSEPTAFYAEVKRQVQATGARLVVIDSLHDVFSGNENIRGNARQFISDLRAIVLPVDGAVLLLSHPSMSGMNSGTGAAGSTAWHNAVRSRLYLTRPNIKPANFSGESNPEDDGDPDERVLKTMKSNYGAIGGKIALRWERGVFVAQGNTSQPTTLLDRLDIDRRVLEAVRSLVENDTKVAADKNAAKGLANLVRKMPATKKLGWQQAGDSQDRLITSGKLVKVEMGPPSHRVVYLRPPECRYAGEKGGVQ
jgi:RecA-family ATPase